MTRLSVTLGIVVAAVLTAAVLLPVAHADAQLDMAVNVTGYETTNETVDSLTVELTNHEPQPKTVVFATWAKQGKRMATWTPPDGSRRHTVEPGETRTLVISRDDFKATNQPVMLTVRTVDGNERTNDIFRPEAR